MPIAPKHITARFTLLPTTPGAQPPNFPTTKTPDLYLTNLRTSCVVTKQGGQGMSSVQLAIFGMNLSDMNQLSTLGLNIQLVQKSTVTVQAGDFLTGMYTVVQGATVYSAYADFNGSAQVPFRVVAHSGGYEAVNWITPTSFQGAFDVKDAARAIAQKGNLNFEAPNDLSVTLRNRTYTGSVRQQAMQLVQEANVAWTIDDATFAIWKKNENRPSQLVELTPTTGLISYPSFTKSGVFIQASYNSKIKYGGQVRVRGSIIDPANKVWTVQTLTHTLESAVPGGKWETAIEGIDSSFSQKQATQ